MNEIKKLDECIKELEKERENELDSRRRMSSDPRRKHSYGQYEHFKKQVDERYDKRISPLRQQIDELKRRLLSDPSDSDSDSDNSEGGKFSYMSGDSCNKDRQGMDTRKTNNELASDDDSYRSDYEDADAMSSSAKKRKWASLGGSDDVIEIDSSSDSETNTDESDDDDVVEIITNSNDIEDDDGLPAEGEKGEECHPNSNSEFNDSHDDVAHAEGEIDDEGSNVHNESDSDYESNIDESKKDRELSDDENDGESNSIGKDANAIDNHEEEVEDIINNDELDNHNDAIDMMDDNNEELGVTDDSVSERDYSSGDEDDIDGEIERYHVSKIEKSKLTMVAQGFRCQANSHQSAADDDGRIDQATTASESNAAFDPTSVEYHGRTYRKNHCYVLKGREMCTVGVKRFTSNNTALCILIVRFDDTILGIDVEGSDYKADYMMGQYVQVHNRIENVSLSRFDREAESVKCIPRLIYSDQTPGKWYTFGYFYDRAEIMQRRGKKRQDMRSLEIFAGAGGSMLGYKNNGFVTVMAVENDSDAVATLRLNNPETNVYEGCIRKFIDDYKTLKCALGRIDHIHFSSPCQDFSKANRHQATGAHRDRADLSLLLVDLVRLTSCSTAVFENVVGIFDRNNVHYLKNISKGLLQLGYQVRCTCLYSCDYGDPQKRPRIFMFIAKKSVPMPSFPAPTHGISSGWNFTTVKEALSRVKNDGSLSNMGGRTTGAKPGQHGFVRLMPYDCAPTIRASSVTPFHYSEDRCINVREAACLQSFPIDYKFLGSVRSQYRQVGNAVPVELATAVAQSIRQILMFEYNDERGDE